LVGDRLSSRRREKSLVERVLGHVPAEREIVGVPLAGGAEGEVAC
jgi:hypothetical protein